MIVKIHLKERRNPKFNATNVCPDVAIRDPFAGNSLRSAGLKRDLGGTTEIFDAESIK